ncbi:MAG TPA: polysaccharide deacetylase family protein [Nitrososphaeraceae archaeon]|nr:polysaccharide deacetylase family protein [Nitrososphaeraceae archaeon]
MANSYAENRLFNYKNYMTMWTCYLIVLVSFLSPFFINENFTYANSNNNLNGTTNVIDGVGTKCNCVVFRMDDIQDYWLNSVQPTVMDLFLSKNQNLSLGLILHIVGNDSKIVDKIKAGLDKRLFELDLHGWDHINYTKLGQNEQKDSLYKANSKMEKIFGIKSIVFIPPFDTFNNDTIAAMKELGIRIISSGSHEENSFNQNKSIFIANGGSNNNSKIVLPKLNDGNEKKIPNGITASKIYHLPGTIFFKDFENGKWVKTPLVDILGNASRNIARYGYAVIVLHPQDFANTSNGTTISTNPINKKEISDLVRLIDYFVSRNVKIVPFHKVIAFSSSKL